MMDYVIPLVVVAAAFLVVRSLWPGRGAGGRCCGDPHCHSKRHKRPDDAGTLGQAD